TRVTRGEDQVLGQMEKQLNKLICVIKVGDFTETEHVERELVLIKVRADERTRGELANIVDIFRAKIIDVSRESYVVEITGAEEKVSALVELLKPLGILEIVRTGKVAMYRGARARQVPGLRPRLQHPLPEDRPARRRERLHGGAQGPGPPRAQRVPEGPRRPLPPRPRAGPERRYQAPRARLRQGDRRHARRGPRDHLQGRDRDRSLRRAVGPLRRADRAHPRRLRDAGRGRLLARDGVLRVPAR